MRGSTLCPETGEPLSFAMRSDAASVTKHWRRSLNLTCPHCGVEHRVKFKDVYIEGVLASFTADFDKFGLAIPDRAKTLTVREVDRP